MSPSSQNSIFSGRYKVMQFLTCANVAFEAGILQGWPSVSEQQRSSSVK